MTHPLQHYAWLMYVLIAFADTMIEFGISPIDFSTSVFSKRNAKKPSTVIGIHMAFLAVLLQFIWLAFYFYESRYRSLPDWLTEAQGKGINLYEVFSILAVMLIGAIEWRWIYVKSDTDDPGTDGETPLERY